MNKRASGTRRAARTLVDAVENAMVQAENAGLVLHKAQGQAYTGETLELTTGSMKNLGSCSYMGLELRPELKQGTIDATERYGTQFSYSRAFVSSPLYEELEELLGQMTGGQVMVAPSTTLAHIGALPVLVEPGDAVIVDQFAHASLQTAVGLLKGIPVTGVVHSRMDLLEQKLEELSVEHNRVWYVLDGLYSMLGDFFPAKELEQLLRQYPKLHLYIDDAHSTSWTGTHGRGFALEHLADRSRVIVALSLNKAFSAAGGALVFPDATLRTRVRRCSGPMMFSGPVQPPMLGAAVASARLHLTPEFADLQERLLERIDLVLSLSQSLDVGLPTHDRTPVFFVRCGKEDVTYGIVQALWKRGFYVSPSAFPAVPLGRAGLRFTISMHNSFEDLRAFMAALSEELTRAGVAMLPRRAQAG